VYVLDNKYQDKARQSFAVELPKRTYLLQAGDRKQMSKWVDFLSACKITLQCHHAHAPIHRDTTVLHCYGSIMSHVPSRCVNFLDDSIAVICARIWTDAACKKWESSSYGMDEPAGSAVAEGVPPDGADGGMQATAAATRRAEELVAKMASSSKIDPADTKRASSLSDQQVGFG